jgi:excisionase family DNA binding protein
MGGRQIDEAVLTEVCDILKPAALAATAQALTHADEQEDVRLAAFETAAERTRYAAERAWRQFDACEPENRLVARTLEAAWEAALAEAETAQGRTRPATQRRPTPLTDEELAWLSSAGADIRTVLDADTTTQQERKRLLRALIAKVVITIGDDTPEVIDVTIHWQGGATTDVALPRRRQGRSYRATDEDTVQLVRRLARYYDDKTIARLLNRQHRTTATGLRFTAHRVCNLRASYDIAVFTPDVAPVDDDAPMVSITDAAAALDISRHTIYRWIRDGFIAAIQPTDGAPWRIRLDDQLRAKVAEDAPEGMGRTRSGRRHPRRRTPDRVASGPTRRTQRRARPPRQARRPPYPGRRRPTWTVCNTRMREDAMRRQVLAEPVLDGRGGLAATLVAVRGGVGARELEGRGVVVQPRQVDVEASDRVQDQAGQQAGPVGIEQPGQHPPDPVVVEQRSTSQRPDRPLSGRSVPPTRPAHTRGRGASPGCGSPPPAPPQVTAAGARRPARGPRAAGRSRAGRRRR